MTFSPLSRLFGAKCDKCLRSFGKSDYVMRAKNKIFHLECFQSSKMVAVPPSWVICSAPVNKRRPGAEENV